MQRANKLLYGSEIVWEYNKHLFYILSIKNTPK